MMPSTSTTSCSPLASALHFQSHLEENSGQILRNSLLSLNGGCVFQTCLMGSQRHSHHVGMKTHACETTPAISPVFMESGSSMGLWFDRVYGYSARHGLGAYNHSSISLFLLTSGPGYQDSSVITTLPWATLVAQDFTDEMATLLGLWCVRVVPP